MRLTPGMRLRSQVCSTEVIIVRAPATEVDLTCGGHPMIHLDASPMEGLTIRDGLAGGSPLGKRFARPGGDVELLVTKAGDGVLGVGAQPLVPKDAPQLPASD